MISACHIPVLMCRRWCWLRRGTTTNNNNITRRYHSDAWSSTFARRLGEDARCHLCIFVWGRVWIRPIGARGCWCGMETWSACWTVGGLRWPHGRPLSLWMDESSAILRIAESTPLQRVSKSCRALFTPCPHEPDVWALMLISLRSLEWQPRMHRQRNNSILFFQPQKIFIYI